MVMPPMESVTGSSTKQIQINESWKFIRDQKSPQSTSSYITGKQASGNKKTPTKKTHGIS